MGGERMLLANLTYWVPCWLYFCKLCSQRCSALKRKGAVSQAWSGSLYTPIRSIGKEGQPDSISGYACNTDSFITFRWERSTS